MGYDRLGQQRSGTLRSVGRSRGEATGGGPSEKDGNTRDSARPKAASRGSDAKKGGSSNFAQLAREVRGYKKVSGSGDAARSVSASKVKKGRLGE